MSCVSARALTTMIGASLNRRTCRMQSKPVDPAQHQIDDHQLGGARAHDLHPALAAVRLDDAVALVLQRQPNSVRMSVVVLHHDHPHHLDIVALRSWPGCLRSGQEVDRHVTAKVRQVLPQPFVARLQACHKQTRER